MLAAQEHCPYRFLPRDPSQGLGPEVRIGMHARRTSIVYSAHVSIIFAFLVPEVGDGSKSFTSTKTECGTVAPTISVLHRSLGEMSDFEG